MKTIFNYDSFLENMEKKFKNTLFVVPTTSCNKTKNKKPKKRNKSNEKEENDTKEEEEKVVREILDALEKKCSKKSQSKGIHYKNEVYTNECISTSGVYTSGYVSTLSSCNQNTAPTINDFIIESIKEKDHNDSKKKKVIPKINLIKKKVEINATINNIKDLIDLTEQYPLSDETEYNINMTALHKIKTELKELNSMIGMKEMKENVVDQLLYYIQDLHNTSSNGDFMHTVIYGPPGTGKTEIAKIIGRIFCNLGILKKGIFKKVTRSDLVAGYLGQTAIKTKDVIQECIGGVLFIDEAYALGNVEKRDSFSKECIDTLCEALSDHKDDLMVIIAGYDTELKDCFFSYNQGLDSRFTWRFKTENYNSSDLFQIFLKKVKDTGWTVDENSKINAEWFEKNMVYFKFFGRDIETMFSKIKIAHGRRIFCKPEADRKKITFADLEKGFDMFLKNDDVKNRKDSESINKMLMSLYV